MQGILGGKLRKPCWFPPGTSSESDPRNGCRNVVEMFYTPVYLQELNNTVHDDRTFQTCLFQYFVPSIFCTSIDPHDWPCSPCPWKWHRPSHATSWWLPATVVLAYLHGHSWLNQEPRSWAGIGGGRGGNSIWDSMIQVYWYTTVSLNPSQNILRDHIRDQKIACTISSTCSCNTIYS